MSTLIIELPACPKVGSDTDPQSVLEPAGLAARDVAYVLSAEGQAPTRQGRCALGLLPRADNVVAVLSPSDVSWHRITLPKSPPNRLRAALAGLLEEALLEDTEAMHFAVAPQAKAGEPTWVAVCKLSWLQTQLAALEQAHVRVDRVVPSIWPDEPATAYFHEALEGSDSRPSGDVLLSWSTDQGVATWPMVGSLSHALLPSPLPAQARFVAVPVVAAQAERWLGRPVRVQSQAEHLLQASHSLWNVLQFELSPRNKGLSAAHQQWRRLMGPAWRPARLGLAALLGVQLLGLNLWAWQQQRELKQQQGELTRLLQSTYPQVRVVLDAPIQMQRETEALRAAAGEVGEQDLETLLGAVASVWPPEVASPSLQYDGASLTLAPPPAWGAGEIDALRQQLTATGVQMEVSDGRLILRRASRS